MSQHDLPLFQCHTRVRACLIHSVDRDEATDKWTVTPAEPYLDPFEVPRAFVARQGPRAGMYLVRMRNGFLAVSTAKEFEDNYAAVDALEERRDELLRQLADVNNAIKANSQGETP